jgi:hypothetical protein
MMWAIRFHLVQNGMTASLVSQNSPSSERWCRYTHGVTTSSSNGAAFGSGLLQSSWW